MAWHKRAAVAVTVATGALTACAPQGDLTVQRELTVAERIQLQQAEERLTRACMAREGFPYWIQAPLSVEERQGFGFVLDDVGWATRNGYGSRIQQRVLDTKKSNANLRYRGSLTKARLARYTAALSGGPGAPVLSVALPAGGTISSLLGGCQAKAQEELYGDRETWFRVDKIATNLSPLYLPDLVEDERFSTALRAWSRCMGREGHTYANPSEIRSALPRLTKGLTSAKAYAVEVRLAVAEATCARTSALADTGRALQREYRDRASKPYTADLALHSRLEHAALARAGQLTGTGA